MPLPDGVLRRYDMDDASNGRCCWRILTPAWSHRPLSGDGAALHGGRWNAKGRPALYVSERGFTTPHDIAWAEFQQGLGTRIGTVVPYEMRIDKLVDLTDSETRHVLGLRQSDFYCAWQAIMLRGETPPTWTIANRLIEGGADAVLVPSMVYPQGRNIVVWNLDNRAGCEVRVVDPDNALPVDQASWPPVTGLA